MNMMININYSKILYSISLCLITLGVCTAFLGENTINKYYTLSFFPLFIWFLIEVKKDISQKLMIASFPIIIILITNFLVVLCLKDISNTSIIMLFDVFILLSINTSKGNNFSIPIFLLMSLISASAMIYALSLSFMLLLAKDYMTIVGFNPQSIGTWAYILFASGLIAIDIIGFRIKTIYKFILAIIALLFAIVLFGVAVITETRSAELGMIFLIIVRLLPRMRIVKTVLFPIIVSLLPALVVVCSFLFLIFGIGADMEGGTVLDAREYIWLSYLDVDVFQIAFGNLIEYENVYTHNIYMDLLVSHGAIVLILFISLTAITVKHVCAKLNTRVQYDSLFAFVGALIVASFEGMVFSIGCGGMYLYAYSFLMIANRK